MTREQAIEFMAEMAKMFTSQVDHTREDRAHWAARQNAENCIKVAGILRGEVNDP